MPGLPAIDPGSFPEAARASVRTAHDGLLAGPLDADSNGRMAMLAHAHGQPGPSLDLYQRAAALQPEAFRWPYLSAVVLAGQGRNEQAIDSLRRALAIDAGYPAAQLRLAELLHKDGRTEESRATFAALIDAQPNNASALFGMAQLLQEQGERAAAAELLERAVVLVPHYGAAHHQLAQLYRAQGDAPRAELYTKLFQKYANSGPPPRDPVLAAVEGLRESSAQKIVQAGRLSAAGKLQEAADVLVELLEQDPGNIAAHINLIGLFGSLGQVDRARSHYDVGRTLDPGAVKLHNNFGILLLRQQRYAEAVPAFRAAIAADSDYAVPYKYLGLCLQNLDRMDEAVENYRAAYVRDPLDHQAVYLLGNALLEQGDVRGAIDNLQRALQPANAKTPSYLRTLARAYLLDGDPGRSEETLRRARESASGFGQARLVAAIDGDLAELSRRAEDPAH